MLHPIDSFRDALTAAGLRTADDIIPDGKIQRFHIDGDKPRSKNGWYVMYPDGVAAGAFGSFKHDVSVTWCSKAADQLTEVERQEYRRRMEAAKQARAAQLEADRQEARERALRIWKRAKPANDNHPYLVRKQVSSFGLRQIHNSVVVPMYTPDRVLQSLQFIDADGNKLFLRNGMKRGCYFKIGGAATDRVIVVEGYATAASLHMAHGCPVVVAFDAGNLQPVAEALRPLLPSNVAIDIYADNDNQQKCQECGTMFDVNQFPEFCPDCGSVHKRRNTGLEKANAAAEAIGATVYAPPTGGDFNDMAVEFGLDALRDASPVPVLEPIDIFAEFPVPPIKRDMLPDAIADYSFDQAELVGVEPAMIAIPALVACASALHDGVQLQVKRHETGWRESARLWCAVVGNPSIKKSPSIAKAISRVRKINADLAEDNKKLLAQHASEMEAFKDAKKEAKKTGEHVTAPEQPQLHRLVVQDTTVEALSEVLKDNSRGILCLQDELSGWFGSMDAYSGGKAGGKDRAHWLEAYNGGGRTVDRVMRGTVNIPNWSVCMIGGIQPDAIRRIAQNMTDDGLMQRFMIVVGRNAKEYDRQEDTLAHNRFRDLVDHLHAVTPGKDPVTMTEEAHAIREALNQHTADLMEFGTLPGGLISHLGKWSGLFARLTLLFHAIECHAESQHPTQRQVSGETARRVDLLMRKFLLPHALAYYTDVLGAASELEHARGIAAYILAKKLNIVTKRDLMHHYKQWRGLDDWKRQKVMQVLEDMGWIIPMDDARESRKGAHTWAVVGSVHVNFADKAAHEAEKRARIRDEIQAMKNAE